MFRFGASNMLFAYLLVPSLAALYWWARLQTRRDLARFGDRHLLERLTDTVSRRGRIWKALLLLVANAAARHGAGAAPVRQSRPRRSAGRVRTS